MPIPFSNRDVASEVEGVSSALIVPCIMCPAATVAVREKEPFLQLFKSFFKSAPFERYIKALTCPRLRYHLLSHTFQPLVLGARSPERRQIQERWIAPNRLWGWGPIAQ